MPDTAATPTGRARLRSERGWRGPEKLVLQIECRGMHTTCTAGHIDTEHVTFWRDARTSDLTPALLELVSV